MNQPGESDNAAAFPALSKRAARRAIQRAFVLVGRDRRIRQHLCEADLTTLWMLEDWGLEWTVVLDHGRLEFHRGRVGKPNLTFAWRTAEAFFSQIETGRPVEDAFEWCRRCGVEEALRAALRRLLRFASWRPAQPNRRRRRTLAVAPAFRPARAAERAALQNRRQGRRLL